MSETTDPPVVRAKGLGLSYGKARALDGVTLDIPAGCMVGLIGPDGVGKSSLLALIAGARRMQEGRLEVLGGDMASAAHRTRTGPRIAYMPQGLGRNLYLTLSVFENIDFFGRLFGLSKDDRRHRIAMLLRATGRKTFGRDEAETRAVLCSDSRARFSGSGRADDGRRSAVAAAILAIDPQHPRWPPWHEHSDRHRLHGGGGRVRLAGGHG